MPERERPIRQPLHPAIDEDAIRRLVHSFYADIRRDGELGPIFQSVIGEDWNPHLAKMCDFWSSVMMMTGRYRGNPMAVHGRLAMVRPEHFTRWLALFRATAERLFAPEVAALFIAKAEMIARSLQLGMFYRPGAAATSYPPSTSSG
ncbi:MAG TPA: group III truncated hemoglobin [Rhizomicrobium sp.]|nr:group III truncated hemoglobin [Rhizomicrobium sp.]